MPREGSAYTDPFARLTSNAYQRKREAVREALGDRPFVVWDGEGARAEGKRKPQNYVLLGCYDGSEHRYITGERLTTTECLSFIVNTGQLVPDAFHVSFAFDYDVNMILRNLSPTSFAFLAKNGHCRVGGNIRVEHIPGKWFRVTERGPLWPHVPTDRRTVTIFDCWGFFQSSLLSALRSYIPDHPLMARIDEVEAGKGKRAAFTYTQLDFITEYWKVENELFHACINKLRELLYAVDLRISKWHGPGALASFVYAREGIRQHKSDCGPVVYDAARYAYAGGRFERYHIGRYTDAYGYDINSAYPNAISRLPSLSEGEWIHNDRPRSFQEFGCYRVSLRGPGISRRPSPLFHRDTAGNITYPHRLDGWYWSPELRAMQETMPDLGSIVIHEGWEYVGWKTRPFEFVQDAYEQRRIMKANGDGAQMALKLMLNSLYGKMAQRAGWERTGRAPTWHQLEWAGWVTSHTRAKLFTLMHQIPYDKLIAVETDGIYTTATPDELGIIDSKELGGWEVTHIDELIYLQSGVYAKRTDNDWSFKYRGLDSNSFGDTERERSERIAAYCRSLGPNGTWGTLVGTTTRFIGYRNALFREAQNRGPMKAHYCVWETETREIDCGSVGKRIHSPAICAACKVGANAYDMPHETVVKSRTLISTDDELMSQRHDIPWLQDDTAWWREYEKAV